MIYANVIGCDLGPKSRLSVVSPPCSGSTCWRKNMTITPGATISDGIIMTLPVLVCDARRAGVTSLLLTVMSH